MMCVCMCPPLPRIVHDNPAGLANLLMTIAEFVGDLIVDPHSNGCQRFPVARFQETIGTRISCAVSCFVETLGNPGPALPGRPVG
jgi:hypothetical protein